MPKNGHKAANFPVYPESKGEIFNQKHCNFSLKIIRKWMFTFNSHICASYEWWVCDRIEFVSFVFHSAIVASSIFHDSRFNDEYRILNIVSILIRDAWFIHWNKFFFWFAILVSYITNEQIKMSQKSNNSMLFFLWHIQTVHITSGSVPKALQWIFNFSPSTTAIFSGIFFA